MTAPELLPCPFCGGEAHIDGTSWTTRDGKDQSWVTCKKCGTYGPSSPNAIAAWNARADIADLARVTAELHVTDKLWLSEGKLSLDRLIRAEAAEARVARLVDALIWYGEQSRLCRLIHSEGGPGRHALSEDGGKRARAALSDIKEAPDA